MTDDGSCFRNDVGDTVGIRLDAVAVVPHEQELAHIRAGKTRRYTPASS